jgi:cyclohexa-1,5-dienecarbonyl-CoA hydratase
MDYQNISFEVASGVARLTFKRPPLNVLNIAMMREISSALDRFDQATAKVLVIAAEGKAFSAGVDVAEHTADKVAEMIEVFHGIFRRLDRLDVPTLAIVQGAALGGGCEVALFCDLILASDKAKFGQPEIKVGVFPPIAAVMLPRLVSRAKALELLLTGETIDAGEAYRLGLVNKVVPPDQLQAAAGEMIGKLTSLSGVVLRTTKRAARWGGQGTFGEALNQVESLYLSELMKTHDANEGLMAFLEKRPPVWKDQ